jgi:hypothetical protein
MTDNIVPLDQYRRTKRRMDRDGAVQEFERIIERRLGKFDDLSPGLQSAIEGLREFVRGGEDDAPGPEAA